MINGLLVTSHSEGWFKSLTVNVSDITRGTKNIFGYFTQDSKEIHMFSGETSNPPKGPFTRRLDFPSPEITDRLEKYVEITSYLCIKWIFSFLL